MGPSYGVTAVSPNGSQLQHIADLIADGKVKPILDRTYTLEEAA
jgi:NADPH:quinone reductase-like Zn-dependent oxidoreductase